MNSAGQQSHSHRTRVPARLHDAPTANGLIIPYITLRHRGDRLPVWGEADPHRMARAFRDCLCQICGQPHEEKFVVCIRPQDYLLGVALEPALHPVCAGYAVSSCAMLAGLMHQHRAHPPSARTQLCEDDACHCRVWRPVEPTARQGHPAEAWYSAWIDRRDYHIVHTPGDDRTPAATGINIGDNRIRRVRKIRSAAGSSADQYNALDGLAAWQTMDRLIGRP